MPTGVVKKWMDQKGIGFITPDDGSEDVFCHVSCLLDGDGSVQEGDAVKFRVEYDDRKGKDRAVDVEATRGGGGGGGGGRRGGGRSRSPPRRGRSPPRRGGGGRGRDDSREPPPRRGGGGGGGRRDDSRGRRGGGGKGGGGKGGGRGPSRAGEKGVGEVLRWHDDKGFGFIKPDNGGEDIFCHASGLLDGDGSVQSGDRVTYVIGTDERNGKDRATEVAVEGGGGGRGGGGGGGGRKRDDSRRR